jgi:DUF4097 and DUF4098 domain-containing protein YvlB
MSKLLTTLTLLALLIAPALAAGPVDETRPAEPNARITFNAVTGHFDIIGTSDDQLTITGTLGEDVEEMTIEGTAGDWRIALKADKDTSRWSRSRSSSRLTIGVPRGAELNLRTVSGDLSLLDLDGDWIELHSVSGRIELDQVQPERLDIETVSGGLSLDRGGRLETRLKSVSGHIDADQLHGRVRASSVSGNLTLIVRDASEVDLDSVSGRIQASIEPLDQARINANTHSGGVRIRLPESAPVHLRATTFSGRIESDFGGQVQRGRGPGERLEHRTGSGQVRVEARSFSAGIQISHLP